MSNREENARAMVENPMFEGMFNAVRESLVKAAENAPVKDVELHHALILSMQLLPRIKKQCLAYLDDKKIKAFNAEQKKRFS